MAFTFAAFSYIVALIIDAFLIFFAIFHVSFCCNARLGGSEIFEFHFDLDVWSVQRSADIFS